ncbi:atrial natriuretic peptide-converting enzyme-like [Glandiceps talaboti]
MDTEGCHEHVDLFMCSALAPECGINGTYRLPCQGFCEDVRENCEGSLVESGYGWVVNCSILPTAQESEDCVRVTPCLTEPCHNNGTCLPSGENNYTCICTPGYVGVDCEIDFDECGSMPCVNSGTCIDGVNEYSCRCTVGYAGRQCDCVDITVEICRNLELNYGRLRQFSESSTRSSSNAIARFLERERQQRAGPCYEHIGYFMCALFAPECSDDGFYRPPCQHFCQLAREQCEPKFNAGGIDWIIDCDMLPNSNDSETCIPDPGILSG